MRGLAPNFASTHQTENPRGFSEVGENKQLLIAIVRQRILFIIFNCPFYNSQRFIVFKFNFFNPIIF
ncbi:hypothetical protein DU428_13160 [Oceanihabitans sediminis]|uniref:Uncharacterized protein n=1 Tax=Oceanihabitans sediminis TaxID=1812012 RepID=A0A368P3B8_9FLAO|nr:hypothetical protein DU428_13160 [Oceanihabitans sediminis]